MERPREAKHRREKGKRANGYRRKEGEEKRKKKEKEVAGEAIFYESWQQVKTAWIKANKLSCAKFSWNGQVEGSSAPPPMNVKRCGGNARIRHEERGWKKKKNHAEESKGKREEEEGNGLYQTGRWSTFRFFPLLPFLPQPPESDSLSHPSPSDHGPSLIVFHSFLRPFHFVTVWVARRPCETFTVPHGWPG